MARNVRVLREPTIRRLLAPALEELGRTNRERIEALLPLFAEGKASLFACLQTAFPEKEPAGSRARARARIHVQAQFRALRMAVNSALANVGQKAQFQVDTDKRAAPEDRTCWFEGDSGADEELSQLAAASAEPLDRIADDAAVIPQQALARTGASLEATKQPVHFFLSYAHDDDGDVPRLLEFLNEQLGPSLRYRYETWADWKIELGTGWRQAIEDAIEQCDFGLLLVSPNFLASPFIQKEELPKLLREKPVIPVCVRQVNFKLHALPGLDEKQIFFLAESPAWKRSFDKCSTTKLRREFAARLHEEIERRLDSHFDAKSRGPGNKLAGPVAAVAERDADGAPGADAEDRMFELAERGGHDSATRHFVAPKARSLALRELECAPTTAPKSSEPGVDALEYLQRWATDPDEPPFCAVLGEYGIGKTTTLRRLTRQLLEARRGDAASPMPIFVDLRNIRIGRGAEEVPRLEEILAAQLRQAGPARPGAAITPGDIIEAVQQRGAVIQQIREYVEAVLGGAEKAKLVLDLIASVHDLGQVASRPYSLSVLVEHVPEMEARRARGERVLGVTLYEILVNRWLTRDDGKHQFTRSDKLELMERLAADMFAAGAREWSWREVEQWLGRLLAARPEMMVRYGSKDPTLLDEDLRTATFVLRPDDSREQFRFAHSSLQEYFHARQLCRALDAGTTDAWQIPMPSLETLDFVGQILELEQEPRRRRCLTTLATLLTRGEPMAARVALRCWLLAVERGYPQPEPDRPKLAGLDLEGWKLRGASRTRSLFLGGVDLSGARLDHAEFQWVRLLGAKLTGASCRLGQFQEVDLSSAELDGADFTGATFRLCTARDLRGGNARWYDADWIRSNPEGAGLGPDFARQGTLSRCRTDGIGVSRPAPPPPNGHELSDRGGHHDSVVACAWSPDGRRLLSSSDDKTLRVWDAAKGYNVHTLKEHTAPIFACAWSPDGRRILSGSHDSTLRVWDAETGACLRVHALPAPGEAATWDPVTNRILWASPGAWRHLGWRYRDPEAGRVRILPAEHFGPLPG